MNGTFEISYGDGSSVSGPKLTDTGMSLLPSAHQALCSRFGCATVTVAGITATSQAFSAVTTLSDKFAGDPMDGILGMAFQKISSIGAPPFVNQAKAQGSLRQAVFGMKLAKEGSELYLGGTDASMYSGAVEYHDVTDSGYWQIPGAAALVNGEAVNQEFETVCIP